MNRASYGLGDLKNITNSILSKKFKRNLEIGIEEFLEKENKIFELKKRQA